MPSKTLATRVGVAVVVVVVVAVGLLASGALRSLSGNDQSLAAIGNANLDVTQGFNFSAGSQTPVGYLTSLTLGTTTYTPDITVKVPTAPQTTKAVVGVLSSAQWNGGKTDPIQLKAQISTANKQKVAVYVQSPTNLSAQFTFVVYAYDPVSKAYYASLTGTGTASLQAQVVKTGTAVEVALDTSPGSVASPQNWGLSIAFAPQLVSQTLTYKTSPSASVVKPWGS